MTLHELSEKIEVVADQYAAKFKIHRDDDWYMMKLQEELGELTQHFLMMTGRARTKGYSQAELRKGFEEEIADTFCQLILLAKHFDLDIPEAVKAKWFQFLGE